MLKCQQEVFVVGILDGAIPFPRPTLVAPQVFLPYREEIISPESFTEARVKGYKFIRYHHDVERHSGQLRHQIFNTSFSQ